MSLSVCPVALVAAPVEVVWDFLRPERFNEWIDGHVERIDPPGPPAIGQHIEIAARAMGRTWHASAVVEVVDPERHQLGMFWHFPLGMRLRERVVATPVDAVSCRVRYG